MTSGHQENGGPPLFTRLGEWCARWAGIPLAVFLILLPWQSGVRIGRVTSLVLFLLATAIIVLRDRSSARHLLGWIPPVAAVLGALVLSSFFSMESSFSFKTFFRQHLWFFLTFLAIGAWAITPARQWWVIRWLAISGGVSAGVGILLYYFAVSLEEAGWILRSHRYIYTATDEDGQIYHRAQGTMMSYTRSAMVMMITIPAAMAWLARGLRNRRAWEIAVVSMILLVSVYYLGLTKARGAWVGTCFGGMLAFVLVGGGLRLALAAMVAILLSGLAMPTVRDRAGTFIEHLSQPDLLLSGRLHLWSQGVRPIRENLWFGVGYGGDIFLQDKVMAEYELMTDRRQPDLHQLYLQTLAETGVIGVVAYGWFVGLLVLTLIYHLRANAPPWEDLPGLAVGGSVLAAFLLLGSIYYFNEEQVAHLLFVVTGLIAASRGLEAGSGKKLGH
ncbi:MAG: O-antigen ligase family protein [Candidatus Sumerlaeia bacterium]|nr:O-antigen ligase family protein [Candidatus Sumerlaeia bacterium]